jgi:phosphoglycolate phosphatase
MQSGQPRPYDLLIFDWDGTLIDSIGSIVGCTRRTLEELELPPVDDEVIRAGIGLGLRHAVEGLAPGCDDATFVRICEVYRKHWLATFRHGPSLFAESAATLGRLKGEGYVLAVATAKGREGLDRELETTGLTGLFEATRTVTESPGKPDPGMVLDLLDETLCERTRALVIGDTIHDVQMARNAKVSAVGVTSGTTGSADLLAAGALSCLPGVAELPGWLASRGLRSEGGADDGEDAGEGWSGPPHSYPVR